MCFYDVTSLWSDRKCLSRNVIAVIERFIFHQTLFSQIDLEEIELAGNFKAGLVSFSQK